MISGTVFDQFGGVLRNPLRMRSKCEELDREIFAFAETS
jgi:hypothetical protein